MNHQRLKITLAYDGATFSGWQRQANGDTVQSRLEAALTRVTKTPVTVHGAGRTDAGVHALAQVAHAEVPLLQMNPAAWRNALNANLPPTIRVNAVRSVSDNFHARFSATGKIYRYTICTRDVLPPFDADRAWHIPQSIDPDQLRRAFDHFVGRHDFRAFSANRGGPPVANTVREIRSIQISPAPGMIRITFTGDGFLYKMVRILTASAVRVAQSRDPVSTLTTRLTNPNGPKSHHVAPAAGLTLVRVLYAPR